MLDAVDRLSGYHVNKVLDVSNRPDHVKVHLEFGTNVVLTGTDMSGDEGEARRGEACT